MIVAPFPFDSLPKVTRAEVAAQVRLRHLGARFAPKDALERGLTETLGTPVTIRMGRARGVVEGVTAAFAAGEHVVAIDVEAALAREVVARSLKHVSGIDGGKTPSATLHGAFAAVLHHAFRRADIGPLRVTRAAPARAMVLRLAIDVAGSTYDASVTIPDAVSTPAPSGSFPNELSFPIELPLVATSCLASMADLDALGPGDVFVAPGLGAAGSFALIAPTSERGIAVEVTTDGRVVIGKDRFAQQSWEPPMDETNNPTLEVALEAPVVVRVELGAVEMKAREWASLAEGDVISLQRKVGELAILRIAGAEVARGELVQVDGEYGIRITSIPPLPGKGIR